MHHAARNLKVKVVRKIVAIAKDRGQWILGDARTYNNKSQGHWTALMCVLDLSPSRNLTGEEFDKWQYRMKEVVTELLRVMTLDGMAAHGSLWDHLLAHHCVAGAPVSHSHLHQ